MKAFFKKVQQADRLVTLRTHMQHIDAITVFGSEVSTMLDQQPDEHEVTMERCEVQRCEGVLALRAHVYPVAQ